MTYNRETYKRFRNKLLCDPIRYQQYLEKNRMRMRKRLENPKVREYYRRNTKKWIKNQRKIDPQFQEKTNKRLKFYKERNRKLVIDYYSNGTFKCDCCGESEYLFLEIDHLNNNGNKHRKLINRDNIESWLIKNNFPAGFRILCCNCNKGKHLNGGKCPHEI